MNSPDPQLVQLITQQVLAVLRERGIVGEVAATVRNEQGTRAEVRPPIGVCTGDYSQFPELAGRQVGAGKQDDLIPPAVTVAPLTGIITANQLQAAMDAASDGVAVIASDARLSPLANDLARKLANKVRRVDAAAAGSPTVDSADLPWLWWIDGACPVVTSVTGERATRLRLSSAPRSNASLGAVVREIAGLIKARKIAGAFLFVHNASRAMCLANRCVSIRAVVGTCGEAVEQGITELGANVLVIEYPHHGYRGTTAMVDRMLQQPPRPPASIERELADLHRCG